MLHIRAALVLVPVFTIGCGGGDGGGDAEAGDESSDVEQDVGEDAADAPDRLDRPEADDGGGEVPASCGDGVVQDPEECDDANAADGDGCAGCAVEERWSCSGQPSTCERLGDYHVAPDGDDAASGDLLHPFATLNRAWAAVEAGDLVYVRGGTFAFDEQQNLTGKSGTAENPIRVWAYPGETPVLSRSASYAANQGLLFTGDYVHFRGLVLTGYEQKPVAEGGGNVSAGLRVRDASHNVFERIDSHHNGHGMRIENASDDNLVLNCDFHHNQDPYTTPDTFGNADGLEICYIPAGLSNTVRGCRFWWNTDDGIDLWDNDGNVVIDGCWAWNNGFVPDTATEGGDGNGFKLGVTTVDLGSAVLRTLTRCLAFDNLGHGFDQNGGLCSMTLFNNSAFANGHSGFAFGYSDAPMTATNNVSYRNTNDDDFSTASVLDHNSWDGSVTVSDEDFASVTPTGMDGPRQPDGSLPELPFMRLASGSDLIDAGVDVGLPFAGTAPDLGAFETAGD